jgi:hypothetical protein
MANKTRSTTFNESMAAFAMAITLISAKSNSFVEAGGI